MSKDAADLFRISHDDLWRFLSYDANGSAAKPVKSEVSNSTKHIILVVSVFLFAIAFFTCAVTLTIWAILRSRNKKNGYEEVKKTESAELACDEKSLNGIVKSTPSLPQVFDKPKLPLEIAARQSPGEEELRKLRVESIDLTASFYTNRDRLQVNVRRVNLTNFNETLRDNAFTYLIVSLEPGASFDPSYYESELRPVAAENYFEEASEFEVTLNDVPSITLKVSVYASDRFSQHRLVNEYTYKMVCSVDPDATTQLPILAVTLTEASRSDDNKVPEGMMKEGEILFSLCYMPTSGRLTFVALKGRNICDHHETPIATYLRVSLMVSGKTMKTVQTTLVQKSSNPVYNEAFVFHTPLERIKDTDIVVSLLSSEDISSPQPKMLGKVIVGPVSGTNLGRKHWEAMLSAPRRPVAQWHGICEFL